MSNITPTQIKAAESVVRQSLKFFDDNIAIKSELALEFNQKVQELNLVLNKMNDLSDQLLQKNIDKEDRTRLLAGLNTREMKTYKDKYAGQSDILQLYKQYVRWSGTLGFEPPSFSDGVIGSSLSYLRKGTLSEIKDVMSQISSIDKEVGDFQFKLDDAINNATKYKQILEKQLQDVQNTVISDSDPDKVFKQEVKNITETELNDRIDLWKKVEEFVTSEPTSDGGYTFNNLEYAAEPVEPLSYDIGRVYFDNVTRIYYTELWFSDVVDRKYVTSDTAIDYYKVDPDLLLDTVNFVTEIDEQGNPYVNYQKVVLSTKFGIIPNQDYMATVEIPILDNQSVHFQRRVGPKIKAVNYAASNQIHVQFTTAEIDLELEGIREETVLILHRAAASNKDNYSLKDIKGNDIVINYIFLEDDLFTVTICLEDDLTNKMGYVIEVQNLFFEKGNGIIGDNGRFNFAFSDPYPIAGLTGLYDNSTDVVALIWVPSVQDDISGYNIYRQAELEKVFTKINDSVVVEEKYVDIFTEANKNYKYAIAVVNLSGDESILSSVFNIITS